MNQPLSVMEPSTAQKRQALAQLLRDQAEAPRRYPVSFAQQRLWFLDQLEPGSSFYNIPLAMRLRGALNERALQRTLNEVVRRHAVLRTTFTAENGQPMQVVSPPRPLHPAVIDLSHLSAQERDVEARRLTAEEAQRSFDLSAGPLLRVTLLKLAENDHAALFTMHHIISDGWSMGVLFDEIKKLYSAYAAGHHPILPELPIQYADFAVWQRKWLQGEVLEQQLDYWRKQLTGDLAPLQLPADRPRPSVQSHRGQLVNFIVLEELSAQLKKLCLAEGVTTFMALLAAFQALLSRYSGQTQIAIGTPIANRNRAETEALIGFFVNTLVLRTDLSGDPSFSELLRRVKEVTLGAYEHQDVPFEKLVEELQPERDLSRSPLFQVMFVLQNVPGSQPQLEGVDFTTFPVETDTTKFDLTLGMIEQGEVIIGGINYNSDIFDAATVEQIANSLQTLLEAASRDSSQRLSQLPLLTPAEQHRLLVEWNDTGVNVGELKSVPELFAEQVARTPNAIALVYEEEQLTFAELNGRANQVAQRLRRLGVGLEARVGLCVERSLEMVVGLLGIMKAGGAYVALDPAYPRERLRFMLADAAVQVLVTQAPVQDELKLEAREIVLLDQLGDEDDVELEVAVAPENLAYVIYTSGSSGTPKGVMVQHAAVVNLAAALQQAVYEQFGGRAETSPAKAQRRKEELLSSNAAALGDSASLRETACAPAGGGPWRVGLNASLAFDASVKQVVQLLAGSTLVLLPEELRREGEELLAYVERRQIAVLDCTPTQLQILLAAGLQRQSSLVALLVGGEAISSELWQELQRAEAGLRYFNVYGPTECTVDATVCLLGADAKRVTIGRPVANVQCYILDARQEPVPVGVVGELYIGGAGVARGYLEQPGLTAERFLPDPFSAVEGARVYRTGDLARYQADGQIEYVGRADGQVKVRGYRIELGEIESALRQQAGVSNAAAVVQRDRIVGYVVADAGHEIKVDQLQAQLKRMLPEYMLPSALVLLEELPQTGSGKVDRRALAQLEVSDAHLQESYQEPRTPVEEALCGMWQELLRVERIGIKDNFFELGGHSLMATQLVSRVREAFDVELGLRELFERPTVAGLAEKVEAGLRGGNSAAVPPLVAASREGELPLSYAQQRLWFLDQLEPGSVAYNIPKVIRLSGKLDVAALERTLNEVVRRHEVLRTTFAVVNGQPVQVIAETAEVALPVIDLSELEGRESEAWRIAEEEAQQPFDLSVGPLLRVRLLRLGEEEHVVLFTLHHIVSDGWSTGILVREVAALYEAYTEGRESPLPELTVQYADYAVWQREWLQGEVLEQQLAYWRKQLGGELPVLQLPTDRPRPAVPSHRGGQITFSLPAQVTTELKKLSRTEGVTLFMTLLALFKALLSRYSGQSEVVVGTPIAGRNHLATEDLIGLFVNTLVLRTSLSGNPSFGELLARVREITLGAYAHQDLPFEKLVEELQPEREMSRSPLFQVMFILQNATTTATGTLRLPGLQSSGAESSAEPAKFDLTLALIESGGQLHGSMQYSIDLFDRNTIEQMVQHFKILIEGAVIDPGRQLSRLPLLTEAEQHELLVQWNNTQASYEQQWLPQLFEQQVSKTPATVAVVFEEHELTYRELNARANQLAHRLRRLGIGPDAPVGVVMERSLEMVVALLGIIKAGGAYVPLDPEYPEQRLSFMMADAGLPVLLTQSHLLASLPDDQPAVLIALDTEDLSSERADDPVSITTGQNLAYCIYTSGSTGQPKGALNTHAGISNRLQWMQSAYQLTAADRVLQKTTFSFDVSVWEFFWPLITGARLVIARPGGQRDSSYLTHVIREQEITTVHFVPSMLQVFLEAEDVASCPSLKRVVCSGEALPFELQEQFFARLGKVELHNLYGPTEAAVDVTFWDCEEAAGARVVPIGKPVANTEIYILDQHLNPTPAGVAGELYIGGVQLARGYLNRPELTAERFVPHPFSRNSGERLYRTGDLARYRSEGQIEFAGRVDNQVKMRGYRIELGEIESRLRSHPAVREAVVIATIDQRLVAYLVTSQRVDDLRVYLRERLPDYMIPAAFILLDQLPLTANGKLDRRALPPPEQFCTAPALTTPRDVLELQLTQIWEEILRREHIGLKDSFFDLGGHSLLAVRLINKVERLTGEKAPLSLLFQARTIEQMAATLRQQYGRSEQSIVCLQSNGSLPPLFLVHPASGNVMCYVELARRLGTEQPIYGLQARGLDPDYEAIASVEEMASQYLEELSAIQPDGPYFLGGWSVGGVIAFEMARQLRAQDKSVAPLLLIDSYLQVPQSDDATLLVGLGQHHGLFLDSAAEMLAELRRMSSDEQLEYFHAAAVASGRFPGDIGIPELRALFKLFKTNTEANQNYMPAKCEQQVILFQAAEAPAGRAAESLRQWERVAGLGVTVHTAAGNHNTLLTEPNVTQLAEQITRLCSELHDTTAALAQISRKGAKAQREAS